MIPPTPAHQLQGPSLLVKTPPEVYLSIAASSPFSSSSYESSRIAASVRKAVAHQHGAQPQSTTKSYVRARPSPSLATILDNEHGLLSPDTESTHAASSIAAKHDNNTVLGIGKKLIFSPPINTNSLSGVSPIVPSVSAASSHNTVSPLATSFTVSPQQHERATANGTFNASEVRKQHWI